MSLIEGTYLLGICVFPCDFEKGYKKILMNFFPPFLFLFLKRKIPLNVRGKFFQSLSIFFISFKGILIYIYY